MHGLCRNSTQDILMKRRVEGEEYKAMSLTPGQSQETAPIEVFYSYARKDETLRNELEKHLSILQRQGLISAFHDRQIIAGTDLAQAVDTHLETASLILLLISPDFLASDYCYGIEMQRALERHQANEARVIPILLRPVSWEGSPFSILQVLPSNGIALTSRQWHSLDEAFTDVVKGIRGALRDVRRLATSTPPTIWNIPFQRNPVFTGREDLLSRLHTQLQAGQATALSQAQAISGLGGIGKTQVAVEYAYRYRDEYEAVLWTPSDSRESLVSGYIAIARSLN